jgi:hypothetical protein
MTNKLNYDPITLLDALIDKLNLKTDAALAHVLEVAPPVISKLRHCRLPVGALMLIRMHEVTDISIKELRALMGDHRDRFNSEDLIASAFPGVDIDACHKKAA